MTKVWGIFTFTSIMRPAINTLLSKSAGNEQGFVAGMNNAYMSLGNIIGPAVAGTIYDIDMNLPYILGAPINLVFSLTTYQFVHIMVGVFTKLRGSFFVKKILSALLALNLVLTFSMNAVVAEASSNLKIYYFDEELQMGDNTPPFIENGITYVPIGAFLQGITLGMVKWYEAEQAFFISEDYSIYRTAYIDLKNSTIIQNKKITPFHAYTKNNTTYAPIRELSEIFQITVTWNQEEKAIYLDYSDYDHYPEPSEGFLWKVEKNGNVVYLLGSIHVVTQDIYPLRDEINAAFQESDVLVTEVDLLNGLTDEVIAQMSKDKLLSDGTILKDKVIASTYKAVQEIAADHGIEMEYINEMKIWAVASFIDSLNIEDLNYDPGIDIDMYYSELSKERGIPNWELESIPFQSTLYDNFSKAYQEGMLRESIREYYEGSFYYLNSVELADIWAFGDLGSLEYLIKSKMSDGQYYKVMIADRNDGMTEKVIGYLNSSDPQTVFVIAGSLHMVGPDGIVTQLEELGYTVTRL